MFISPGKTVGIIGQGPLAYLTVQTARKLGYRTVVLNNDRNDIALNASDFRILSKNDDIKSLEKLGEVSDVIIYTDYSLDDYLLEKLSEKYYVPQGTRALSLFQDRLIERAFLEDSNINTLPYKTIINFEDLKKSINYTGFPSLIKEINRPNDAGEHIQVNNEQDSISLKDKFTDRTKIIEPFVSPLSEYSIYIANDQYGNSTFSAPVSVDYQAGQLKASAIGGKINPIVVSEMLRISSEINDKLMVVGVVGVNFFVSKNDIVYVNGIIPGIDMAANIFSEEHTPSLIELFIKGLLGWRIRSLNAHTNGLYLPIYGRFLDKAIVQAQLKASWDFSFFPRNNEPEEASRIVGQIFIPGDNLSEIIQTVNFTHIVD